MASFFLRWGEKQNYAGLKSFWNNNNVCLLKLFLEKEIFDICLKF